MPQLRRSFKASSLPTSIPFFLILKDSPGCQFHNYPQVKVPTSEHWMNVSAQMCTFDVLKFGPKRDRDMRRESEGERQNEKPEFHLSSSWQWRDYQELIGQINLDLAASPVNLFCSPPPFLSPFLTSFLLCFSLSFFLLLFSLFTVYFLALPNASCWGTGFLRP